MQHPHLSSKFWLSSGSSSGGGANCEDSLDHQHLFMGRTPPDKFPLLKNKFCMQDALHLPYDSLKLRFRQTPPIERMQYRLSWNTNASQNTDKISNAPYVNDQKQQNPLEDEANDSSYRGHSLTLFPYSSAVSLPENLRELRQNKRLAKTSSLVSTISSAHATGSNSSQNIHKSIATNSQLSLNGKESSAVLNFNLRSLRIGEITPDNVRNGAVTIRNSRIKQSNADILSKKSIREAEEIISIGTLIPTGTAMTSLSNPNDEQKVNSIPRNRYNSLNDYADSSDSASKSCGVKKKEQINEKCTYLDPITGASSYFNQRLSDLATLEQETLRWERSRMLRKKRLSKSD